MKLTTILLLSTFFIAFLFSDSVASHKQPCITKIVTTKKTVIAPTKTTITVSTCTTTGTTTTVTVTSPTVVTTCKVPEKCTARPHPPCISKGQKPTPGIPPCPTCIPKGQKPTPGIPPCPGCVTVITKPTCIPTVTVITIPVNCPHQGY
ncbi:microtubule-actin cross-linking factor 1 isoform X25 [Rhizophagus clarus]|uniref:Microtubule-actin cross-linking factor 1 isoform X25 n=1 Tax=Rhizophagus clarus TaxID=94130 RepID=A0A8H3MHA5_9GLOM|nr:microtubule-actin cross-linking factor 1 isoform X25 [Rhizophagus clarus]